MTIAERLARFGASVVALGALVTLVPWLLVGAARTRFGGPAPWSGVPTPSTWDIDTIRTTLTGRITESLLADVLLRVALVTAWLTLGVLLLTVLAEVLHQVRHGGIGLPRVRGLGWGQPAARHLAAGLLILTSLSAGPKVAATDLLTVRIVPAAAESSVSTLTAEAVVAMVDPPVLSNPGRAPVAGRSDPTTYVVEPGDSVYGIAERLAGGDADAAVRLAGRILDLNLGRTMAGGGRFVNAAYIEPGWVLDLPGAAPAGGSAEQLHRVAPGDTLWRIARDRLGDPTRWEEIWQVNAGREMDDGRRFDDPSTIHPGWVLELPTDPSSPLTQAPSLGREPLADAPWGELPDESAVNERPDDTDEPDVLGVQLSEVDVLGVQLSEVEVLGVQPSEVDVLGVQPSDVDALGVQLSDVGVDGVDVDGVDAEQPTWPAAAEGLAASPLLGLGRAAAMSAGMLALLAALRVRQLRAARPGARLPTPSPAAARVERQLRVISVGDPTVRLDLAVRCLAAAVADRDVQFTVCTVAGDGTAEFRLSGPVDLPLPWVGSGRRWALPGRTPVDQLAAVARTVDAPSPALVQLGVDLDGREVHVDLEALGTMVIDAAPSEAEAVLTAIGVTLAGSPLAEVARILTVGLDPLCLVHHPNAATLDRLDDALESLTCDPSGSSTFALRAWGRGGEAWEPTIVLAGPDRALDEREPPTVVPGRGSALVVAGAAVPAATALRAEADRWVLTGGAVDDEVELTPIGLDRDERAELAELVRHATEPLPDPEVDPVVDPDAASSNGSNASSPGLPIDGWPIMVRLLGPVDVIAPDGARAEFEKSKTLELLAWMSTHRDRSTRSAARTALWEADVRDATFANVVSAARRSLAQLVPPPSGEPWVGRSQGDRLPLHPAIALDADLVEVRLVASRTLTDDAAIEMLEPALDLVRGLPFEGTSYLWPDSEGITSRLVLVAVEVSAELARRHLDRGDVGGVLRATERGLRVLPGHEDLIALRLRAHAQAGDPAGLRHEWEAHLRVVASDPWGDGEPAPALAALFDELRPTRAGVSRSVDA